MSLSKSELKIQLRSSSKQIPFNVSLPWEDSVAAYLNLSVEELIEN